MVQRRRTTTSAFGAGRREGHDASGFYARFTLPSLSNDEVVNPNPAEVLDRIYVGDSREMRHLEDSSVALVVTSPPYFAGKEYEQALGEGHVPAGYLEFLEALHDVFKECVRVLEPGGRIAVNVANLGRKPYRSLSRDVIDILEGRLGLLLRGEILWVKGQGASGSCAWGSFQSPANPVLRDLTERIIVASKGRFDRALSRKKRAQAGLPSEISISRDDFMELTTDLWEFPPESAHRVGHPAPFPVELPQRLIELYTYRGDVVVDPFAGSGSTAVAALRSGRHFVCYDVDSHYVETARARLEQERKRMEASHQTPPRALVRLPAVARAPSQGSPPGDDSFAHAVAEGRRAKEIALAVLRRSGFKVVEVNRRFAGGIEVSFVGEDRTGKKWLFDVAGLLSAVRPGLQRNEILWRTLGKAAVLRSIAKEDPLILLTVALPSKSSTGAQALQAARSGVLHDVVDLLSDAGSERLRVYASGRCRRRPLGDIPFPET